ncbi:MAG: 3'(2'),5'-bisphosphate nucleotidase CysQ [Acidobacteriaceae bacterium]|nr:3'(2'),5'-bisphosphate nucleotidase CysQ [Acidobacteriaceae bacterium]MBV9296368.1 3'(2'),5'-bisphosphate nucleotidase CysQ [Acidobacteriaceae bacterium]MBV9765663.1 3'(2'),5'-bisphosphate nucleotidase CysQ [Acidobacteriaceae bacterium]
MAEDLDRISAALAAAVEVLAPFRPGSVAFTEKNSSGPVTEADRLVNETLREMLVRDGEAWFSEESVDTSDRLNKDRVWIVDPLDGTREFIEGVPEWSVSIGLVEHGAPVAGGICNPSTREVFVGSLQGGVTYNGSPVQASGRTELRGATVLASRSEFKRGEWERFRDAPFEIRPVGSVAYKLALVASGQADATWTFTRKNEWDIAGGIALVRAAGGVVKAPDDAPLILNRASFQFSGLIACGAALWRDIEDFLRPISGASAGPRRPSPTRRPNSFSV